MKHQGFKTLSATWEADADLFTQWDLKERLLSAAKEHAEATGVTIVSTRFSAIVLTAGGEAKVEEFRARLDREFRLILGALGENQGMNHGLRFALI